MELDAAQKSVSESSAWDEVFKGIAQLRKTSDGTGIGMALTIQKKDGIPGRVVGDGEEPTAAVAVRKVNNTDFYCFRAKDLGERLKLGIHKALALIWKLGLQQDAQCFSEITIGKSQFKWYSQTALVRLRDENPKVHIDAVCREYSSRIRKKE